VIFVWLIILIILCLTVPEAESDPELESPWYIFNDFVVQNVSEAEALSFPGRWKVNDNIVLQHRILNHVLILGSKYNLPGTQRHEG
jgi:hypothetical protein